MTLDLMTSCYHAASKHGNTLQFGDYQKQIPNGQFDGVFEATIFAKLSMIIG